jgi:hypothetical protein
VHVLGPLNALIGPAACERIVVSGDHDDREVEASEAVCDPPAGVWGHVLVLPEVTTDRHGIDVV